VRQKWRSDEGEVTDRGVGVGCRLENTLNGTNGRSLLSILQLILEKFIL
jgi:hypothetical protein